MNQRAFEHQLREEGYGTPVLKEFEPNADSEMHCHEFSCLLLVVEGEFRLATRQGSQSYWPGETCRVNAGDPHAEQAGAHGARILLAKK